MTMNEPGAGASSMRAVPLLPLFEGLDSTTMARVVAAFVWRTYERGDRIGWAERADARTVVMVSGAGRLVRIGPDRRLADRAAQRPLHADHRHQPARADAPHLAEEHARHVTGSRHDNGR